MSTDRAVTIIVSDLHMGGGRNDPWDDHVYQNGEFVLFVKQLASMDEGQRGDEELVINGDFLEFAQVRPEVYTLGSAAYWCSEAESLEKLEAIIEGHQTIFDALRGFAARGNRLTLVAGNHDVDLYWPGVQARLREVCGAVEFELGQECISRYAGRLGISHGHQLDPVNSFADWHDPIREAGDTKRLEMCPGTLFMVKFVNWLERQYPFADNVKPLTALADILLKHDRVGFVAVAWMLLRFGGRHPIVTLESEHAPAPGRFPEMLRQAAKYHSEFRRRVEAVRETVRQAGGADLGDPASASDDEWASWMVRSLGIVDPDQFLSVFDGVSTATLGLGSATTLGMAGSEMKSNVERFRQTAERELGGMRSVRQFVVLGHTHQPDQIIDGEGAYFNPGSWTRFVPYDHDKAANLTLEDLRHEEQFPYELNYVKIAKQRDSHLIGSMVQFKRDARPPFA